MKNNKEAIADQPRRKMELARKQSKSDKSTSNKQNDRQHNSTEE